MGRIHSFRFFMLILVCFITTAMAHDGQPDMGFAWQNDRIQVDTQNQGHSLNGHTAFTIPFSGTLTPYRMADSSLRGFNFIPGSLIRYQFESTLMKWSVTENRWLRDGFDEHLSVRLSFATRFVSASEGENTQGVVISSDSTGQFQGVHPTFELQKTDGFPPDDGAYLIAMTLLGIDPNNSSIIHPPSKPFLLVFHLNTNGGFDQTAYNQALNVFPGITLSDYSRIDPLFNWAEATYPELFPHPVHSRFVFGIYARCYDNSICVGTRRGRVFTTGGPFGGLTDHGPLELFFDAAGL